MKIIIKVEDLDCANCAAKLERGIKELPGVNTVSVSFMAQKIVADVEDGISATFKKDVEKLAKKLVPDMTVL